MPSFRKETLRVAVVATLIVAAVVLVYGRSIGFGFIVFDDPVYVEENPRVAAGLTPEGILWSFGEVGRAGNWHPVTWLSLMLDVELFGVRPGAHHAVNVALHAMAAVVLLLALFRMISRSAGHGRGALWIAGVVAALFALHPMRVESVVWISQRKDVLGALLFMLALLSWQRYVERPGIRRYAVTLVVVILGLMAKPTLVALPAVLVLLDVWPLGRVDVKRKAGEVARRTALLAAEKLPMVLACGGAAVLTWIAQQRGGALSTIPFEARIANAAIWTVAYGAKVVWPAGLAPFYPFPGAIGAPRALAAAVLVVTATIAAVVALKRRPWITTGWLWYLVGLAPVIGVVHVGMQAAADRYTYLPHVGLYLIAGCATFEISRRGTAVARAARVTVVAWIVALASATWVQVGYWRDSETLFMRALAVTSGNYVARHGLGLALAAQGRYLEAEAHYRRALEIEPTYTPASRELWRLLLDRGGASEEAVEHMVEITRSHPDDEQAWLDLGLAYLGVGRPLDALSAFERAANLDVTSFEAWNQIGVARDWLGETKLAVEAYSRAAMLRPDRVEAHLNLGSALLRTGDALRARGAYVRAVELRPESVDARLGLGVSCLLTGDHDAASEQLDRLLEIDPERAARFGATLRGDDNEPEVDR